MRCGSRRLERPPHPSPLPRKRGRGSRTLRFREARRAGTSRARLRSRLRRQGSIRKRSKRWRRGRSERALRRARTFVQLRRAAVPAPSPPPAGERVGVRGRFLQLVPDRVDHRIGVGERVMVPEPQHAPAGARQHRGPVRVLFGSLGMLSTIELHHQQMLDAGEIEDESLRAMLPPELHAELVIAQSRPEPRFRVRLLMSKAVSMVHG
jgi:hypothetical protein